MTFYVEVPPAILFPTRTPQDGVERGGYPAGLQSPLGPAAPSCIIQEHNFLNPSDIAKDSLINLLSLPSTDPKHQYDQLCINFVEYLDHCEQKGFMIKGFDTESGKILNLPMEYNNRWGPSRRKDLSDKLERLNFWFEMQEDRPCTMITLTCYHEGKTISQAWHELNKSRSKLLKLIANYYGNVDYLWVPEPHKSGYVHYHLAVFAQIDNTKKDKHGEGLEDKFRRLWSKKYQTGSHTYGLDFSHKKGDSKIQHLKNYLSKYLEKGFLMKSWSTGLLLFNAHLWDTGFRMYGASKRIREMMNIKDEKPNQIVWLETKMKSIELTLDNEEVEIDKIIWYRLYIPDWIDSPMWLTESGKIMGTDPPAQYLYDWGRPLGYTAPEPILYNPTAARRERNKDTGW